MHLFLDGNFIARSSMAFNLNVQANGMCELNILLLNVCVYLMHAKFEHFVEYNLCFKWLGVNVAKKARILSNFIISINRIEDGNLQYFKCSRCIHLRYHVYKQNHPHQWLTLITTSFRYWSSKLSTDSKLKRKLWFFLNKNILNCMRLRPNVHIILFVICVAFLFRKKNVNVL